MFGKKKIARYFQECWWTCISNQNSSVSWLQSLEFPAVTFCNFNAMKNFTTQSGDKKLTEIVHQLQAQSKALIRLGNFKAERVRDRSQSFVREISSAFDSTQDWNVRIENLRTVSYLQIRQKCRVTILPKQYLKAATQKTSSWAKKTSKTQKILIRDIKEERKCQCFWRKRTCRFLLYWDISLVIWSCLAHLEECHAGEELCLTLTDNLDNALKTSGFKAIWHYLIFQ